MFRNILKIAFRNIIRHRIVSLINILGLAAGMACTILILLWVKDELSYDRFHKNVDNIYLVLRGDQGDEIAATSKLLAGALVKDLPEIKNATYCMPVPAEYKFLIRNGSNAFEENVLVAAENFFDFFSFGFKAGTPRTALAEPGLIVITAQAAKKYFGNENPLGKELAVSAFGIKCLMKVSGVLEDIPSQSHIQSQIIIPQSWLTSIGMGKHFDSWDQQSFHTYIETENKSNLNELKSKIAECELKNYSYKDAQDLRYSLLPLTKIHLYGSGIKFLDSAGDIKYVRIFIAIAIIILIIASINYMNLAAALSLKRAKEVGIRKTVGASRKDLVLQFFGEGLILSFIALLLSILIIELFLPEFNLISGKNIVISLNDFYFTGLLILVTVVTGLISGSYPALLLSSFLPEQIFRGKPKINSHGISIRKGLVIFQFASSITIIICTVVVLSQLSFIRNSSPGFDKENILCIRISGEVNSRFNGLKQELLKDPAITALTRSEQLNGNLSKTGGADWPGRQADEASSFVIFTSDFDLAQVYKLKVSQGRFFSDDFPSDSNCVVLNDAAINAMRLKSPVGQEISLWGSKRRIIGVLKDFHFTSFHSSIEPLIIIPPTSDMGEKVLTTLSLRFRPGRPDEVLSFIEKKWKDLFPGTPFNYYFFDESLNAQYKSEMRMSTIFEYFSILSILISCLGLFGLTTLSAEQRTKEIGIRKVLGASVSSISLLLSKEFLMWVAISNVIAFPAAWYLMNNWLQDFAYRISFGWWMFALAGSIALIIAIITVSIQALKAAFANPVDSMRYE